MRGYFGIGLLTAAIAASACAENSVKQAAAHPTVAPPSCEAAIDAIGFVCGDGRSFSVRHDLNDACVVVFAGESTYKLPRDGVSGVYTNGVVSFRQSDATATLRGATDTPFEDCALVEQ